MGSLWESKTYLTSKYYQLPVSWAEDILLTGPRSFQRCTVVLCRQGLESYKLPKFDVWKKILPPSWSQTTLVWPFLESKTDQNFMISLNSLIRIGSFPHMLHMPLNWYIGTPCTHCEFLLRNGVGKTCLRKKYILLYECIQKQGKKNFWNSTLAFQAAT